MAIQVQDEISISSLKGTLSGNKVGSDLGNLRTALRSALTEAAQNQVQSRITQLSPLIEGGAAPSVISSAIGLAKSGLRDTKQALFSDIIIGFTDEERRKQDRKTLAFNMINTMIDNGVYADTPDEAILALEQESGLVPGTALAWKATLKIANKQDEDIKNLQIQKLRQDINDSKASATTTGANITDIMQRVINAGGTPEEAAREAAIVLEGQGIQVNLPTLNEWTAQARKLIKQEVPTTPVTGPAPPPQFIKSNYINAGGENVWTPDGRLIKESEIEADIKKHQIGVSPGLVEVGAPSQIGSFFANLFGGKDLESIGITPLK